eukprot:7232840-Prymnesium_polylepis.2
MMTRAGTTATATRTTQASLMLETKKSKRECLMTSRSWTTTCSMMLRRAVLTRWRVFRLRSRRSRRQAVAGPVGATVRRPQPLVTASLHCCAPQ